MQADTEDEIASCTRTGRRGGGTVTARRSPSAIEKKQGREGRDKGMKEGGEKGPELWR